MPCTLHHSAHGGARRFYQIKQTNSSAKMKIKMRKYFYYLSADQRGLNQGYCTFNNWKLLPVDKYIIQLDGKREGGRRVFYQVEPNWPLAYSTMPVLGLRDARPAGCSICESTMPRAQNRVAKGSTLMEDETRCPSGYIIYLWWYLWRRVCRGRGWGRWGSFSAKPQPWANHQPSWYCWKI